MKIVNYCCFSLRGAFEIQTNKTCLSYRSTGQTIKMQTENLGVIYYVNKDFRNEYKGASLQKIEKSVEEDYVSNIRNNCWKERQQSKLTLTNI